MTRVKLTEDGKKALLKLSKGDMRRALNVLQACHAAYDETGETEIYNCTGNPHPSDIETIVHSMLADEFTTSYQSKQIDISQLCHAHSFMLHLCTVINALKTERGLALQDLLSSAFEYIETVELKPHARAYLLDHLATTEYVSDRRKRADLVIDVLIS
jgi:replication factor C subunit 3/5